MNLVAKEFIAARDPADPGLLVLSRFAGAAEQHRHTALADRVCKENVRWWSESFLKALAETEMASGKN
ncbi:hypothetical protein BTHE68_51010 [Burkholderia sp. THE68]|nr:hypothetical protein BTHE68_51010 [Burkholderia sp. THE68]